MAGAALAAVVLAACAGDSSSGEGDTPLPTTTTVDISGRLKTSLVTGRGHVPGGVAYPQVPPVGGDHAPAWQNCGFYAEPVPTERAVHSLEHGAVWITYRPDLPGDQIRVLRALAGGNPYVLVSPWADPPLPAPVVASAWGVQLGADNAADPGVAAFVARFANGPQSPEPGAACRGSAGTSG